MSNPARTVLDRLYRHAEDMPDQLAYKFLHNGAPPDTLTYRQLVQRIRTLAAQFSELAAPGDRALLLYPPGLEFIETFLGCLAAGIIAVPAYPPRKNRKADRLLSIIHDCSPRLVLTTEQTAPSIGQELISIEGGRLCVSTDTIPTHANFAWQNPELDPTAVAFLQYTSGSTGSPRGVMITHKNMVSNEEVIQHSFRHTRESVMVSWLPVFHDMGLIGGALQPLYVGFPSILLSPVTFLQEPIKWLRAIMDHRGTTTGAPNFGWNHCAKTVTEAEKEGLELSSLQVAYNGAEPVRAETLDRFTAAFSRCGFRLQSFFPCYGLAESTLFVSGGPPRRTPVRVRLCSPSLEEHVWTSLNVHRESSRWLVSSGQVSKGTRVEIINPATCQRCRPHEVGEIWIASDSVASGYWNRPEDTKELLQATLADTGEGPFLRTGDLGYVDGGELFITGRLKDLIIIRGRNLYPQDIEAAVERALPFVQPNACAAFATFINGEERLAIVAEADRELVRTARAAEKEQVTTGAHRNGDSAVGTLDALVGKVRQAVIEEFGVPVHSLAFLRPGSFPRTSSGKVQRRSCREGMQTGVWELVHHWKVAALAGTAAPAVPVNGHSLHRVDHHDKAEPAATEDRLHRLLRGIVVKYLRAEVDPSLALADVDLDTSLLSLGVDSIGAAAIARDVEKATGQHLTPEIVFAHPTIRQLTKYLKNRLYVVVAAKAVDDRRGMRFVQNLIEKDRLASTLKTRGCYFYETPFTEIDGNSAVVDGRRMMMLASFSYLGLVGHPEVNQASIDAIKQFGAGAHGVRLLAGTTTLHRELETSLAAFMQAEDAVVYGTGYVTNVATIVSLVGKDGYVIGDELNHASIADGCSFTGGDFAIFKHNDLNDLEQRLHAAGGRNTLVVVDAVYSMEGDIAPIPEISRLCDRYDALLMVDEAHSLGVLGHSGRGVQEHFNLPPDAIDIKMGTLSKALGSQGGFVAGRKEIISFLKHNARGFMFSTASPAPNMAAALKALEILQREPERIDRLRRNTARFLTGVHALGFETTSTESPIIPLLCKTEERTLLMTAKCRERGLYVVPIFYPVVPMQSPRIRITLIATHTDEEIDRAVEILGQVGREVGVIASGNYALPPINGHGKDESSVTEDRLHRLLRGIVVKYLRAEVDPSLALADVDLDTSLLSLGVDSIGAAAIALDVEKATGQHLTPEIVYEYRTIRELARYLVERRIALTAILPEEIAGMHDRRADGSVPNRGNRLLERYIEQTARTDLLRKQGQYFYESILTECNGPWVEIDGRKMLMFSSYSYLGLIGHPAVNAAAKGAIDTFGAGCHGARLIAGTTSLHRQFEQEIAAFVGAASAVIFNTGYVTNLATIGALVGRGDCVIGDEFNHASIVDGCKFSDAEFLTFRHNDILSLEDQLRRAGTRRTLVVVDAVYSMEGDIAPLREIVDLCDRYDAQLMVDEAHSLGVLGKTGRGIQEHFNLHVDAIDIKMGTLSKSLGSCGGYIAGKNKIIDYLKHAARGFLFSVATPVSQVAAAITSLQILRREPERVAALQRNAHRFISGLRKCGFRLPPTETPIVPILCDSEEQALKMTARCRAAGLFLVPIIYPAVPMNAPRLRASVIAAHTDADVDLAVQILGQVAREAGMLS